MGDRFRCRPQVFRVGKSTSERPLPRLHEGTGGPDYLGIRGRRTSAEGKDPGGRVARSRRGLREQVIVAARDEGAGKIGGQGEGSGG